MADDRRPPQPRPGISRTDRLSDAGLERLRRQLESGARPSEQVLRQWVRRYGDAAQRLIDDYSVEPGPDVADHAADSGDRG